jgi:hypothetical protein
MEWRGLGIGWREVLGLLIGLAICYGVLHYALTNASQYREAASEQARESSQPDTTEQQSASPETSDEKTKTVTIRITGSSGESFGANYGNQNSSRSVEGATPADYEARVNTGSSSGDYITATAWKTTGDSKELKVQIVDKGTVVKESSTTKDYGAAGLRWRPNDPPEPPSGTTTPEPERQADKYTVLRP